VCSNVWFSKIFFIVIQFIQIALQEIKSDLYIVTRKF